MENLDYFFDDITTNQSREILLEDPTPFSFLIRKVKREYVVTFLDNNLEFRDEKIPTRTDSLLRQHHHELQSPQDIFQYIRSNSCKWLHPVSRANRAYGNINIPCIPCIYRTRPQEGIYHQTSTNHWEACHERIQGYESVSERLVLLSGGFCGHIRTFRTVSHNIGETTQL